MIENFYEFRTKDQLEFTGEIQNDLYSIIKQELGCYFDDKYEESMDELATSSSYSQIQFYENCSQTIRRVKLALKDKKQTGLQNYINTKRSELKDGLMSIKDQKQLNIAIDALEKCNKNILQLIYNITQEIKEGVLKRNLSCYELITTYYDKKISKKYNNFQEFIEDTYAYLENSINLVYGGYNYGKKH